MQQITISSVVTTLACSGCVSLRLLCVYSTASRMFSQGSSDAEQRLLVCVDKYTAVYVVQLL